MRVRLTPEAQTDFAEGRLWYRERGHGFERRFLDSVEACVNFHLEHPERVEGDNSSL